MSRGIRPARPHSKPASQSALWHHFKARTWRLATARAYCASHVQNDMDDSPLLELQAAQVERA